MRLTKEQIILEIRRTAEANGGMPLGEVRLAKETGIRKTDWQHYWARLPDAHSELGLAKNEMKKAYPEKFILDKYSELARDLGRLPTDDDLAYKAKTDKSFPNEAAFHRRYKGKERLVSALQKHCAGNAELAVVGQMCEQYKPPRPEVVNATSSGQSEVFGYVYLVKHGSRREYRIGSTDDPLRREGELRVQLPERLLPVHTITTDDRYGIEAYWLKRFAPKRKNGDWFELDAKDVAAFKKKKVYVKPGGIPNKVQVGDMGVDGRIFPVGTKPAEGGLFSDDWFPIQVKQMDKVGRPDIDAFEAVMLREGEGGRQRGFFVAFSYSRDAEQECAAFHKRTGRIIKLLTVQEILDEEFVQKM